MNSSGFWILVLPAIITELLILIERKARISEYEIPPATKTINLFWLSNVYSSLFYISFPNNPLLYLKPY